MPSTRGCSPPRNQTCISYIPCSGRWVLYHCCHLVSPLLSIPPAILHQEHVMNWMPIRRLCSGLDAPLNGLFFWHTVAPFLGSNMLRMCMVPGRDEGKDGRKGFLLFFFFKAAVIPASNHVCSIPGSYWIIPSRPVPNLQHWGYTWHPHEFLVKVRDFSLLCQKFLDAVCMHAISHQLLNPNQFL